MRDIHEPRPDFVQRLEWQVGAEIRRRNRQATAPQPGPSRRRLIFGALALALASMAAGGAVVAAAYQSQANQERQALAATYERRLELARERLALARTEADAAARRVRIGVAAPESALEAGLKVTEAEVQMRSTENQLAEVRATGREPRFDISAPSISGRDFVAERWQIELLVPESALGLERTRLQAAQRRSQLGLATASDIEAAQARLAELESALDAGQRRLGIRREFVQGKLSAETAELRAAEVETEGRRRALEAQVRLAGRRVAIATQRVEKGLADSVEVAELSLRVRELELEILKADYDLQVIRRRLAGKDQ